MIADFFLPKFKDPGIHPKPQNDSSDSESETSRIQGSRDPVKMIVDFFFQNSRFHGSKDPGLMIFLDSEFEILRIQGSMDPLKKTLHYFS